MTRPLFPAFIASCLLAVPVGADEGHHHDDILDELTAERRIEIDAGDLWLEPESVSVAAGETVRFVVTNTGGLLHDFTVGGADRHERRRAALAMMLDHGMIDATGLDEAAMAMDHGGMDHDGMEGHVMAAEAPGSMLVPPGETRELVWTAPASGNVAIACGIPGHAQAGMTGAVEVGP